MPDRLPSLILLVGFWVPSVLAGRAAAEFAQRRVASGRPAVVYAAMVAFVLASAVVWFFFNWIAIPPYLPGATEDPGYAPPEAIRALALVTVGFVLPVSALACWLAFRGRSRALTRALTRPATR